MNQKLIFHQNQLRFIEQNKINFFVERFGGKNNVISELGQNWEEILEYTYDGPLHFIHLGTRFHDILISRKKKQKQRRLYKDGLERNMEQLSSKKQQNSHREIWLVVGMQRLRNET